MILSLLKLAIRLSRGTLFHAMNLNLPKFNCLYFRLTGQCIVPEERDEQIRSLMSASHSHADADHSPRIALFGSKFTTAGIDDKAEGTLHRTKQGNSITCRLDITYERSASGLSRPPRDYKPMTALIETASKPLGPIDLSCHAIFEYERSEGYVSKVPLPIPLVFPDSDGGATHIEGIEFSLRDDKGVRFKNFVSLAEERDTIMHVIHFEATLKLNRKSLRYMRDRSRSISTRFLEPREGNQNGTTTRMPLGT